LITYKKKSTSQKSRGCRCHRKYIFGKRKSSRLDVKEKRKGKEKRRTEWEGVNCSFKPGENKGKKMA
jgi:hypothetical protein